MRRGILARCLPAGGLTGACLACVAGGAARTVPGGLSGYRDRYMPENRHERAAIMKSHPAYVACSVN
jgi:hypothetical protein